MSTLTARPALESYLREINHTALLTFEAEQDLTRRVALGDVEARDRLVRANLRLVVRIAKHYTGRGLPLEDLIAEGNMGLLRAVEGFDPDAGTRFCTYASHWIKQSIRRGLTTTGRTVRLPQYVVGLMGQWRIAANTLRDELGREPEPHEVAGRLGLSARQTQLVKRALLTMPANQVIDESGDSVPLSDLLADTHSPPPDEGLADTEQLHVLATVLHHLDDRSAVILRMRFGLDGHEPRTLKEIGAELGLTRERVRQLECGALALLRSYLAA